MSNTLRKTEYSPFSRSPPSIRKRKLSRFIRSNESIRYDGKKAYKFRGGKWVRVPEYDVKG